MIFIGPAIIAIILFLCFTDFFITLGIWAIFIAAVIFAAQFLFSLI